MASRTIVTQNRRGPPDHSCYDYFPDSGCRRSISPEPPTCSLKLCEYNLFITFQAHRLPLNGSELRKGPCSHKVDKCGPVLRKACSPECHLSEWLCHYLKKL